MFLVEDVVDNVAGASKRHQFLQGHTEKLAQQVARVSKGSVIQSRRVILALLNIPFPGRDPDLRLGVSDASAGDVARRPSVSMRLRVAERCLLSHPGLVSVVVRRVVRHIVAGLQSSRSRLRCSAQAVVGVAFQFPLGAV
jgi:hypothetical protein